MESWQLTEDNHIDALFKWLDHDEDGLITFDDLQATLGVIMHPEEKQFFRQDTLPSKKLSCSYPGCWEDLRYQKGSTESQAFKIDPISGSPSDLKPAHR